MGVVVATIGGNSALSYLQIAGFKADRYLSKRNVATFSVAVRAGVSFRPAVNDVVSVTDDGAEVFSGIVFAVNERPIVHDKHNWFSVSCIGREYWASVVPFNGVVAAGTLKTQAQVVATTLAASGHGLSFDSSMATGPTLPDQTFPWRFCGDALTQLAVAASGSGSTWSWRVNASGAVGLYEDAITPAPFALTASNGKVTKLASGTTLRDYRNGGYLLYGEGQREVTQSWTGNGVATTFALNYTPVGIPATVVENGATLPVGLVGGDTAPRWNYNTTTNALEVTGSPPGAVTITWTGTAQFPGWVYDRDAAEFAANGQHDFIVKYPDVFDYDLAVTLLAGELAKRTGIVRRVDFETFSAGLVPGQVITITAANYNLSAVACLIDTVSIRSVARKRDGQIVFKYTCSALEGNLARANWQDFYNADRALSGVGSSSAGVGGPGGSTTVTLTGAVVRMDLGGTQRVLFRAPSSGTWFDAPDNREWSVTGSQIAGAIFIRVHLRTRGGAAATIRARLYDQTNAASLGESADVTADAWTYVGFYVTLPSTEVIIELQLRVTGASATTADVGYWSATLENRP